MRIENHKDNILFGAIGIKNCAAVLELKPGVYQCKISVISGTLTFRHHGYDLQVGSWTNPPKDEEETVKIHEGESRMIVFHCEVHDGQADEIMISNESWMKKVSFHMDVDTISQKENICWENPVRRIA